jgi:hypothetical protein
VDLQNSLQNALDNINNSYGNGILAQGKSVETPQPHKGELSATSPSVAYTHPQITSLVENAVTAALVEARKQWKQGGNASACLIEKQYVELQFITVCICVIEGRVETSSGGGGNLEDQLQQVVSRVDVLHEQMQTFDSQAFSFATSSQCDKLNELAVQLETRIARSGWFPMCIIFCLYVIFIKWYNIDWNRDWIIWSWVHLEIIPKLKLPLQKTGMHYLIGNKIKFSDRKYYYSTLFWFVFEMQIRALALTNVGIGKQCRG